MIKFGAMTFNPRHFLVSKVTTESIFLLNRNLISSDKKFNDSFNIIQATDYL